jgi:hypothetical protein
VELNKTVVSGALLIFGLVVRNGPIGDNYWMISD